MQSNLWNKNFTIITIGTVISMLGNAVSAFAIGLLVLDYTNSTFLYALFMVIYNLPKIVIPLFAGPYIDHFSRKKIIYSLDFCSAFIYLGVFFFISSGNFNYIIFLFAVLIIGTIDGVYQVAYDSLYPNLVSEGNYSKAYSISSMIYPLAGCMVPVASVVYYKMGSAAPLFLFNAVSFLIAAIFETQIQCEETHMKAKESQNKKYRLSDYKKDFKQGIGFIKSEKGLLVITAYFCVTMFASAGLGTLALPFFKSHPQLFSNPYFDVVTLFTIVTGFGVLGRLAGGLIHYKFKYPVSKKFTIAICVYTTITILESIELFMPIGLMITSFFVVGILGVTSFNIRISATQSYLPDEKRGRFNGVFSMFCTGGSIIGQLIAGGLGEFVGARKIIIVFNLINLFAIILIMFRGKEHVKKIYNREV